MSARSALPAIATAAAAALLIGCTSTEPSDSGGADISLVKSGKLTTCTHLPYPPFQSRQGEQDRRLRRGPDRPGRQGARGEQEIVDTPFEGIKSGEDLNAGKCDARRRRHDDHRRAQEEPGLLRPVLRRHPGAAHQEGQAVTTLDDLKGKKLGVQAGTTGEEYAKEQAKGVDLVAVRGPRRCCSPRCKTGQVDAGINDNAGALRLRQGQPGHRRSTGRVRHR